ncbi:hypothetical protein Celaphus_00002453 [Cervus elaphus hippelaphus]|uniref:Uncharacterized protein n=1 Tax=Cervus elaphus hippelaphus TaxID=46360 RepID=A0A212CFT1_CEREH|nr:hypothetical protein Celaphus_00002453 [Cervus elaphus hippelaphus]
MTNQPQRSKLKSYHPSMIWTAFLAPCYPPSLLLLTLKTSGSIFLTHPRNVLLQS